MRNRASGLPAVLIASFVAIALFASPLLAQEVPKVDTPKTLAKDSPAGIVGPEFILQAYVNLEDNYYKPEILTRAKQFSAALDGISKFLKHKGVEFIPQKLDAHLSNVEVTNQFKNEYLRAAELAKNIESLNPTDLAFYGVKYMLNSLGSSHVYFMSPEQMEERRKTMTGEALFSGIGAVIQKLGGHKRTDEFEEEVEDKDPFVYIGNVFPGAPADKAGLKRFDRIVLVDGVPVTSKLSDLVKRVKGAKGTPVKITIERGGVRQVVVVIRDDIKAPVPQASFIEKDGKRMMHVLLYSFEPSCIGYIKKMLSENTYDGIIFDVRGNPGGYVEVLGAISSYFLKPNSVLFETVERGEQPAPYLTKKLALAITSPMVVMIDNYSASAAEIMAAAMQDHNRAKVIGDKSAGAVEVGIVVNLPNDAGMVVAIHDVLRPNGTRIEGISVNPDVLVKTEDSFIKAGQDIQLDIASDVLLKEIKK